MPNKAVKWTCLCGKVFTGKWKLYHHIENSHSMEALRNLEQDIKKDQCFYCDNKPSWKLQSVSIARNII